MFGIAKLGKKALEWAEHLSFLREWLLPVAVTMLTAAAGYIEHIPLMWIVMATVLTAMGIVVISLTVVLDLERRNPVNKLQWVTVFHCDLTPAQAPTIGNRNQRRAQKAQNAIQTLSSTQLNPQVSRTIDKGQLGIEVFNSSPFPISCVFYSADTEIEQLQPPRSQYPKDTYLLAPGTKVRFMDDAIDMEQIPCRKLVGSLKMTIKYGKPGREKLELKIDQKAHINMEEWGFVGSIVNDLSQKTD